MNACQPHGSGEEKGGFGNAVWEHLIKDEADYQAHMDAAFFAQQDAMSVV